MAFSCQVDKTGVPYWYLSHLMNTQVDIIVPLSVIRLDIVDGTSMFPIYECARIKMDGTPFVDIVSAYEKKMLEGNKEASLAGSYWYLHPKDLIEYLEGDGFGNTHQIAILGCPCLEEDCWPLRCSVERQEDYIIWYDFYQPHKKQWDYSGFGPFAFEKNQLGDAIEGLKNSFSRSASSRARSFDDRLK